MTEKEKEKRYIYSWDNCVFAALFNSENDKPLDDIIAVWDQVYDDKAGMIVSSAVFVEMLDAIRDPVISGKFEKFLKLSSVTVVDVNRKIARHAANLRYQWLSLATHPKEKRSFKSVDAIMLATAIQHEADILHTFDPDLLRFNGHAIADGVAITKPTLGGGIRRLVFGDPEKLPETPPEKPPQVDANGKYWLSMRPKYGERTCVEWERGMIHYARERTLQHQ